ELVVKGGTVVDAGGSRRADVLIRNGAVAGVGEGLDGERVLDASGCIVAPGLVDLHAHLRQPGREEAETVETAARAAALGGYTAVVAMPNTDPPIDSAAVVREVLDLGTGAACDVRVAGAITVGRRGDQLAPMAEMAALGVRLFTDDGAGVQDARLMRRALEYASALGVTLAQHCEDAELAEGGHMHEGDWSSRLGIPGIPAEAESMMVARDAPQAQEAKELPFDEAPPGMLGLETALALALTELELSVEAVLALMSWQPARIAGLAGQHGGPVAEGAPANLCVIDPAAVWVVEPGRPARRPPHTPD